MMRTRTLLTGGVLLLAAGAIGTIAFTLVQPSPPAAAPAIGSVTTAQVTRGALRDTRTVTGTLGYGTLSTLRPGLDDGSAMLTWLAPVGTIVQRGEPLYRLDGQPAILLYGAVPQHRTLRFEAGAAEPVWVELEQAQIAVEAAQLQLTLEEERLADAETRIGDTTERLADAMSTTPMTAEFIQLAGAVRAAEAKVGRVRQLSAAEFTPSVEVAVAEAEFAAARAALDGAIRALRRDQSAAALDAVTARVAVAGARVALDALREAHEALLARADDSVDIAQLSENLAALGFAGSLADQVRAWQQAAGLPVTGIVAPGQLVIAGGPVHIAAHNASVGETFSASAQNGGEAVLDYSATEKRVVVPLAVADQTLAAVGRAVSVTLPDDTRLDGMIDEVGSVVSNGTIEVIVTIADQAALGGLEVASVEVEFVSESRDGVLSVPVAALLAQPEGGFAVEVVVDGRRRLVPVDTGLFASGRVEVTGDGIAEGQLVGMPG